MGSDWPGMVTRLEGANAYGFTAQVLAMVWRLYEVGDTPLSYKLGAIWSVRHQSEGICIRIRESVGVGGRRD